MKKLILYIVIFITILIVISCTSMAKPQQTIEGTYILEKVFINGQEETEEEKPGFIIARDSRGYIMLMGEFNKQDELHEIMEIALIINEDGNYYIYMNGSELRADLIFEEDRLIFKANENGENIEAFFIKR